MGTTISEAATLTVNPVTPGNSRLTNMSTRAKVQVGNGALIPGFVITGTQSKKLLLRAVGPTGQVIVYEQRADMIPPALANIRGYSLPGDVPDPALFSPPAKQPDGSRSGCAISVARPGNAPPTSEFRPVSAPGAHGPASSTRWRRTR